MKTIFFTEKSETLILEHSKVFTENDTVVYSKTWGDDPESFNVPYRNLQLLVLGKGTSITSDAMNKLAQEGVVITTTKNDGDPIIMTSITGVSSNEYMQAYCARYFAGDAEQLKMAKQLMVFRMKYTDKMSLSSSPIDEDDIERHIKNINKAKSFKELLELEEVTIKNEFYHKYAARYLGSSLQRNGDGKSISPEQEKVNTLLSAGNDLVRGLAANAIWSMGLSPALTLLKDRKNGSSLIYDVADLVKDVLVLPWAFEYSKSTKKDALAQLRYLLKRKKADQAMVDGIKLVCGIK